MRLIDADALLKHKTDHDMISTHLIYNAPTVDTVPVVRCKDCKYYRIYEHTDWTVELCGRIRTTMADPVKEDDYCSKAERRNDETD